VSLWKARLSNIWQLSAAQESFSCPVTNGTVGATVLWKKYWFQTTATSHFMSCGPDMDVRRKLCIALHSLVTGLDINKLKVTGQRHIEFIARAFQQT
jgi:hypothetical protein